MKSMGYSLIECLLAVTILTVLATAAAPLQFGMWQRGQRAMARSALAQASWWLEREASWSGNYPATAVLPVVPLDDLSYRLTYTASNGSYVLRAIPQGRQTGDPCGVLWLNDLGQRGSEGPALSCW